VFFVFATACADEPIALPDATIASDAGVEPVEADGGDAGYPDAEPEPTPIVERPILDVITCTVAQVIEDPSFAGGKVAGNESEAWIALRRDRRLTISPITSTGSISAPIYDQPGNAPLVLDSRADLLFFLGGGGLRSIDRTGQIVSNVPVATLGDTNRIELAVSPGGAALAYSGFLRGHVSFALGGGAPAQEIERFGSYTTTPVEIIALGDEYFVLWEHADAVRYTIFDAAGTALVETATLATPPRSDARSHFDFPLLAAIALDDGTALLAWVESYWNGINYSAHVNGVPLMILDERGEAWAAIRVARIDRRGVILDHARVAAPQRHVDMVEPQLVRAGENVVLDWSEGEHIYSCSGCFPNHRHRMVIIDPRTLSPRSEVAEASVPVGGLLGRSSVFSGGALISVQTIRYHVEASGALTSFTCE
jgi:hypothetical protein